MCPGLSRRTVSTTNSYASTAELFGRVAGELFTAGQPTLVRSGLSDVIVFPPLDRQNQVSFGMHGEQRILVWGQGSIGNRLAGRLVDVTAAELESLGL